MLRKWSRNDENNVLLYQVLGKNLSQCMLHLSPWPWRTEDCYFFGQISHVPGRTDWGCITQAYNCYPGLLRSSFTSQVMPVVSVQPKLTNGVIFSCPSGRLLPLHSMISLVKKLPWCQASSRALPRAENPLVTFCLFQLLALWPSASYLTDLQSRLPWLYNSDDNTSLM